MENAISNKWLAYYADQFSKISDDSLAGYWRMYGKESEQSIGPREMAAWVAVNQEMQHRCL